MQDQVDQVDQAKQERIKAKANELTRELFGKSLILEVWERGAEYPDELGADELTGILIKLTRQWSRLSQPQLAKRSGVRVETISRLENGERRAQHSTIGALARALKVDSRQLDPAYVFGIWRQYLEEKEAEDLREVPKREKAKA